MSAFYVFDRWGNQVGVIERVLSAVHVDEINGEDSLTIETDEFELLKGQRVVWRDKFGLWHEHMVKDTSVAHENGAVECSAYCVNSIAELIGEYIVEREPSGGAALALARALEGTNWQIGIVDVEGTNRTSWYHISAYEAVEHIVEVWGGQLETTIEVSGTRVSSRKVGIRLRRGEDLGQLFAYGRNLESVRREVDPDEVYTALYGYGKGLEKYDEEGNATGGYSRKLTFGEVNGGIDWVGDDEAKEKWGLPDGNGGVKHAFGKVEFSDCEDAEELLRLTKAYLAEVSHPRVTYTGNVISLAKAGYLNGEDTRTGDTVYIRDRVLDERISGQAIRVERNLIDEWDTTITLGNLAPTLTGAQKKMQSDLGWLNDHSTVWDSAANLTGAYVNAVINQWNEVINADGGYVYWEQGDGITVYDKPLDQNPTKAIQIKGGAFRIANSKLPNGDWDWKTFGTGDGFTADLINVGKLVGGSCWWDLETGDLFFNHGTISSPGNSWNLDTGYLTFHHGRIEDATGANYWDLDEGYLKTTAGHIGGFEINDHSIYSGDKNSLASNASGVYVGNDGISVGSGSYNMTMADGYLRGGSASTVTGYVHLYSRVKRADNGQYTGYGTRIAGQNHVSFLTNGIIGIGSYAAYNADATVTVGLSRTITYGASLTGSGTPSKQTGSASVVTGVYTSSIKTLGSAYKNTNAVVTGINSNGSVVRQNLTYVYDVSSSTATVATGARTGSISFCTGYSNLGPTKYTLNTKQVGFTKGLMTTAT